MSKSKTLIINATGKKSSFDMSGITKIKVKNLHGFDFFDLISGAKAKGSTITFTGINGEKIKFTNCKNLKNISLVTDTGLNEYAAGDLYNKVLSYITPIIKPSNSANVSGSVLDDIIDVSLYNVPVSGKNKGKGLTIDAGKGNDTITGTSGKDTITGGSGANRVIIKNEAFGNDTINLTKGEKLTLDMTAYPALTSSDSFKGKVKVSGNNLVIKTDNGKITLKNFAKSNVVSGGYVKIKLSNGEFVDLNSDEVLSYTDENFTTKITKNKKGVITSKTATFNGSRFNESLDVTSELDGYTKTINMGKGRNAVTLTDVTGKNTVTGGSGADILTLTNSGTTSADLSDGANVTTVQGTGKNTIVTGKGNDTFIFGGLDEGTSAETTVKAGSGTNYIRLDSSKGFGKITISEEKLNAKNIIIFENGGADDYNTAEHLADYSFFRINDDLIISNDVTGSSIKIKSYYLERTSKTKYAQIEFMINDEPYSYADFLSATGKHLVLTGSGIINGTKGDDYIVGSNSNDTIKSVSGNDTVIAGLGNDTLYGGKTVDSKTTFIFNSGDGKDTVYSGKGQDTLQFNDVNLSDMSFEQSTKKNNKDLIIKYSDTDQVTVKDYYNVDKKGKITGINPKNSVKRFVVNGENLIVGTLKNDTLTGSDQIDRIYGKDGNDTITGGKGNDYLDGGNGDDTFIFSSGDGHDTIINGSGTDTIKFTTEQNLSFSHNWGNNDLVISYGENDTVTLQNYYVNNSHSVTNIDGTLISDLIQNNVNDIYDFSNGCRVTEITSNGGNDSLIFADGVKLSYKKNLSNNDLIIKYDDNTVTLKGYYTADNYSVTNINGTLISTLMSNVISRMSGKYINNNGNASVASVEGGAFDDMIMLNMLNGASVYGGEGNDVIEVENSENTSIYGETGSNIISVSGSNNTIYGGDGDDDIGVFGSGNVIYGGDGSDSIDIYESDNTTVYGGAGNDDIWSSGVHNTIYGGTGDDNIWISDSYVYDEETDTDTNIRGEHTLIFNNGDGNDVVDAFNNDVTLKFNDTALSEFTLEKCGDSLLIKYNNGEDSVLITDYFDSDSYDDEDDENYEEDDEDENDLNDGDDDGEEDDDGDDDWEDEEEDEDNEDDEDFDEDDSDLNDADEDDDDTEDDEDEDDDDGDDDWEDEDNEDDDTEDDEDDDDLDEDDDEDEEDDEDDEDDWEDEDDDDTNPSTYIIEDKDANKVSLDSLVESYGEIPESDYSDELEVYNFEYIISKNYGNQICENVAGWASGKDGYQGTPQITTCGGETNMNNLIAVSRNTGWQQLEF